MTFTPTQVCTVDVGNPGSGTNDGTVEIIHNGPGGASFVFASGVGASAGGLTTDDLLEDESLNPTALAQALVGTGVTISNVTYTGALPAAGTFAGGQNIIGFSSGIILSSGAVANVVGPNCSTGITLDNGLPGDTDLQSLLPANSPVTTDAADLEFDFVPTGNSVNFRYVFASDEYNEEVGFFNDVFGFFVNGTNAALIPGTNTPVSIDTINDGNSRDAAIPISNPQFFINNDVQTFTPTVNTEMDGLTVVLSVQVPVNAGVTNHIKLAIGDTGDHLFDSNVFIASGSLNSSPLRLSVGTLAFGDEAVGATSPAQTVRLTNGGTNAVDIASIVTSDGIRPDQHLRRFGRCESIVQRQRFVCSRRGGRSSGIVDGDQQCQRAGNRANGELVGHRRHAVDDSSAYERVFPGDDAEHHERAGDCDADEQR